MHYKFEFEMTLELYINLVRQYFWKVILAYRPILLFILSVICFSSSYDLYRFFYQAGELGFVIIIMIVLIAILPLIGLLQWVKAYYNYMKEALNNVDKDSIGKVYIEMDDETLKIKRNKSEIIWQWSQIDNCVNTRDFLFFSKQEGQQFFGLPKSILKKDVLSFLHTKVRKRRKGSSPPKLLF